MSFASLCLRAHSSVFLCAVRYQQRRLRPASQVHQHARLAHLRFAYPFLTLAAAVLQFRVRLVL